MVGAVWGEGEEGGVWRCKAGALPCFYAVPGPLETVQRTDFWGCYYRFASVMAMSFGY